MRHHIGGLILAVAALEFAGDSRKKPMNSIAESERDLASGRMPGSGLLKNDESLA
jgi:hypothetical protein